MKVGQICSSFEAFVIIMKSKELMSQPQSKILSSKDIHFDQDQEVSSLYAFL